MTEPMSITCRAVSARVVAVCRSNPLKLLNCVAVSADRGSAAWT